MSLEVYIKQTWGDFRLDMDFTTKKRTLSLLGASGCGKSMTLKCIAGIEKPAEGRIVLNGRTLFDSEKGIDLPPQQRRVGYLFQSYALFPHMSLKKNIMCGLHYERDKRKKEMKAEEMLERFSLMELAELKPHQLSGGQQQRGALARILITEPEILLLDEPMSALDGYLREQTQMELMDIIREYKKEMILVTHNMKEAFRMSEQTVLMDRGRKIADGETAAVFDEPKTGKGALITGFRNVVPVRMIDEETIEFPMWGIMKKTKRNVQKETAYAGILERGIHLSCEKNGADGEALVWQVMEDPKEIAYSLKVVTGKKDVNEVFLRYVGDKERRFSLGERLWFKLDADKIRLFTE